MKLFECGDAFWSVVKTTTEPIRNRTLSYLSTDNGIGAAIENKEYYKEWLYDVTKQFYIPGSDILDVGAYIGTSSLLFAELITENNCVHAYEPVFHRVLSTNVKNNNLNKRIRVYPVGLSDITEDLFAVKIHDWLVPGTNFGCSALERVPIENTKDEEDIFGTISVTIPMRRLDDIFFSDQNVSIIKIDVVMMETEVLRGMMDTVRANLPVIIIEIWKTKFNSFSTSDVAKALMVLDYYILQLDTPQTSSSAKTNNYVMLPRVKFPLKTESVVSEKNEVADEFVSSKVQGTPPPVPPSSNE